MENLQKCSQGVNNVSSLLRDFTTILIKGMVSQFEISTNYLPPPWIDLHKTEKPSDNNLFLYYTTAINHNVKHVLKEKTITNFDGFRKSAIYIDNEMKELIINFTLVMCPPHMNRNLPCLRSFL